MGGNALNFETKRLQHYDYIVMFDKVWHKLMDSELTTKARLTRHYYDKTDFGDMDIVCKKPAPNDIEERINQYFGNKDYHPNSWCRSFDYQDFQIDLLYFSEDNFETAYFYFSFNDLNNFVGKIAHKFGLKFGHDGLSVPLRSQHGGVVEKLYLSKDPRQIYEFLGYDYDKWVEGFDSLDDIFTFAVSTPYFSVDMFWDKNLNHRTRTRDKKRKVFQKFRAWLEENNIDKIYDFNKDKDEYTDFIDESFPEANYKERLHQFRRRLKKDKMVSEKFNGHIIMELTPLEGKVLGQFIGFIKSQIPDFQEWVLIHDQQEINDKIEDLYCVFTEQ